MTSPNLSSGNPTCAYCPGVPATRTDPFSGDDCCDACFNLLIGGDEDDPPFRCGVGGE